jgi:hypothetical protein
MSLAYRQSVPEIGQELGTHIITLYNSPSAWRMQGQVPVTHKEHEDWRGVVKFTVLLC